MRPTHSKTISRKDTAANKRDQTRYGEGPVEDESRVQTLLTHEVTVEETVSYSYSGRFADSPTCCSGQLRLTTAAGHRQSVRRWRCPRGCRRGGSSSGAQPVRTELSAQTGRHAGVFTPDGLPSKCCIQGN